MSGVDCAHRPDVETRFMKEFVQENTIPDLYVTRAHAETLYEGLGPHRTLIFVLQNPGDGCDIVVDAMDFDHVHAIEVDARFVVEAETFAMWPLPETSKSRA